MWVANMIVCCGICFGAFIWAIWVMMKAEEKKRIAKEGN